MKMNKEKITKDDGRYLIYYTFSDAKEDKCCENEKKEGVKTEDR